MSELSEGQPRGNEQDGADSGISPPAGPLASLEDENERLRALLQGVLPFAEQAHVTAEYRLAWNRIIAAARDACRLSSETTT